MIGDIATRRRRHQTIVMWRFFAGAQWQEIADTLGSPSAEAVKMECLLEVLPAIAALIVASSQITASPLRRRSGVRNVAAAEPVIDCSRREARQLRHAQLASLRPSFGLSPPR